jgi:hypothetical protein
MNMFRVRTKRAQMRYNVRKRLHLHWQKQFDWQAELVETFRWWRTSKLRGYVVTDGYGRRINGMFSFDIDAKDVAMEIAAACHKHATTHLTCTKRADGKFDTVTGPWDVSMDYDMVGLALMEAVMKELEPELFV